MGPTADALLSPNKDFSQQCFSVYNGKILFTQIIELNVPSTKPDSRPDPLQDTVKLLRIRKQKKGMSYLG